MVYLYVAGWGSGSGKSTICQAILEEITERPPVGSAGAVRPCYIKPATQCEDLTAVADYCIRNHIPSVPIGPVVFRQGFTNEVIASDNPALLRSELLSKIVKSASELTSSANGNQQSVLTVVDGVGYPSVGSCCGVGNGDVAKALGAKVLLVAPNGLGDAIDTLELMLHYFSSKQCDVIGVIFNKVRDSVRHKREEIEPLIRKYLTERHPSLALIGFVPFETADNATAAQSPAAEGEQREVCGVRRNVRPYVDFAELWRKVIV